MGAIKAKVTGLDKIRGENRAVKNRMTRGDLNVAAVLPFFDVVSEKFDNEATIWDELSQYRIDRRGGSEHPILDWKHSLRRVATSWDSDSGNKVEIRRRGNGQRMRWTLAGEKVANQFGEDIEWQDKEGGMHSAHVPARPFWPMQSDWAPTTDLMVVPIDSFLDSWVSGDLNKFDRELKLAKSRKRTR